MKSSHFLGWIPARPPCRPRRPGGFTLVEILTATAIMSLIVSLVMTILTQVVSAWNRSSDDLQMSSLASSVFQQVSQDLETAIFRSDGNQWMSLTSEVPQGSPVSDASVSRLIFYTSTPLRQTNDSGTPGAEGNPIPGDICAVEYRVTYSDPFGNDASTSKTFQLHRVAVDPASTFVGVGGQPLMGIGQGHGATAPYLWKAFDNLIDSGGNNPVKSQVQMGQGKSLNIEVSGSGSINSLLADNCAQFNVFLYFYGYSTKPPDGPGPAIQPYPETAYGQITPAAYYYGGAAQSNGSPVSNSSGYLDTYNNPANAPSPPVYFVAMAYADITVTFLTDDGVAQLQQFQGSTPEGFNWQQFVQQYGKTFTQRVRFYNKPR
jgi:prepilin-type N-terminal cleavage/methylation domain-containing protein